jgi:hypothetical protein
VKFRQDAARCYPTYHDMLPHIVITTLLPLPSVKQYQHTLIMSNNSTGDKEASTYSLTKSFGGYPNFMHSYGLMPGQDDGEAAQILDTFREADRDAARSSSQSKSSGGSKGSGTSGSGKSGSKSKVK